MNPLLKTLINVQFRHWILLLAGGGLFKRFGLADEVIEFLRGTDLDYALYLTAGLASLYSIYTRQRGKMETAIARELPGGVPLEVIKDQARAQSWAAILKLKPETWVGLVLVAFFFSGCAGLAVNGNLSLDGRLDPKDAGSTYHAGLGFGGN